MPVTPLPHTGFACANMFEYSNCAYLMKSILVVIPIA